MRSRGRPRGALGDVAIATLELAARRAVTFVDVHRELGLSRRQAIQTVHRGRRDGWLREIGKVELADTPRPVVCVVAARPQVQMRFDCMTSLADLPHLLHQGK